MKQFYNTSVFERNVMSNHEVMDDERVQQSSWRHFGRRFFLSGSLKCHTHRLRIFKVCLPGKG
jgi:hypothetical protein